MSEFNVPIPSLDFPPIDLTNFPSIIGGYYNISLPPIVFGPPPQLLNEHFGPPYPEEYLYYANRITYEDCKHLLERRRCTFADIREERIRLLAYYIWLRNGGADEDNWLEAERAVSRSDAEWKKLTNCGPVVIDVAPPPEITLPSISVFPPIEFQWPVIS